MPSFISLLEAKDFLEHSREVESCEVWQTHVLSSPRFIFLRKGLETYVTVLGIETSDPFYVSQMRKYRLFLYFLCSFEHILYFIYEVCSRTHYYAHGAHKHNVDFSSHLRFNSPTQKTMSLENFCSRIKKIPTHSVRLMRRARWFSCMDVAKRVQ